MGRNQQSGVNWSQDDPPNWTMVAQTWPENTKKWAGLFLPDFFQIWNSGPKIFEKLTPVRIFIFSKNCGPRTGVRSPNRKSDTNSRPKERTISDLRSMRPWTGPISSIDINWSNTRPDRPDGPVNPAQNKRWYGKCIFIYKWMSLLWRIFKINFLSSDWRLVWSQSFDRFVFTWL